MDNILKPKSEKEIWDDIAKLHPVDQFCMKFSYFYNKDPDPNRIPEIIDKCNPGREISWTISRECIEYPIEPGSYARSTYDYNNIIILEIEFKTTFDVFTRTMEFRLGKMTMTGYRNSISYRDNGNYF